MPLQECPECIYDDNEYMGAEDGEITGAEGVEDFEFVGAEGVEDGESGQSEESDG